MTREQILELADSLHRTRYLPQPTATKLFKRKGKVLDNITELLREIGEIFRCENCSTWKSVDIESRCRNYCVDCDPDKE